MSGRMPDKEPEQDDRHDEHVESVDQQRLERGLDPSVAVDAVEDADHVQQVEAQQQEGIAARPVDPLCAEQRDEDQDELYGVQVQRRDEVAHVEHLPPMEEDLEQQGEERDEQQQDHGQPLREPADDVRVDHLAAEVLGLAVLFGGFRAQGTAAAPVDRVAGRGDQITLLEQKSRDAHLQRVAPRTVDHPGDRLQPPELFARPGHPDGRVLPQQVVVLVIPLADLERPQHVGIAQFRELLFPGSQRYIDILGDEERHGQEEECRDEHEQPQRVDIGIDLSGDELEGQYARAAEKEPEGLPHLAVELVDVLEILFEVFPEGLLRIERILSAAVAVHAPERLSAVLAVDICRHRMAAYAPQAVVFDPARQGSAPLLDPIAQRCTEALRRAAGCGVGRYSG